MKVTVLDAFINQCMNKSIIKFGALNDSGDVVDIGESSATVLVDPIGYRPRLIFERLKIRSELHLYQMFLTLEIFICG